MDSDSIIIDEDVLSENCVPERLICREGLIKEIARCLAPFRSGKSIRNLLVCGPPGVGKTVICKSILQDHFPRTSVYVNCWSKRTSHKIWEEILLQIGLIVHGRESASELEKKFEKSRKRIIVCLDEADQMKDAKILYVLARNSCGVILISNTRSFLSRLDDRITSSLPLTDLDFKSYSRTEVVGILKERARSGIRPGSVSDSLLSIIATMTSGDARIGLQILKNAAKDAEAKGLKSVTVEEVRAAAKGTRKHRMSYLLRKLSDHQRAIYTILKNNNAMKSGELYAEYSKTVRDPLVMRAYRKNMRHLQDLGLVKPEGAGRWKKYGIIG